MASMFVVVSNAWDGKKNIINYEYTTTIMVNLFV